MAFEVVIQEIAKISSLIGVQYFLGRRGSYPFGLLLHYDLLQISAIVVISDVFQTIFLLYFFEYFRRLLGRSPWLKKTWDRKKEKNDRFLGRFLREYGTWGLFIISAFPYAGGALSGSLLAVSLNIERRLAFGIIMLGCVCSTTLYYFLFAGIIDLVK